MPPSANAPASRGIGATTVSFHRRQDDEDLLPTRMPGSADEGEQCQFYPSAAAAETAGYRPCVRCRPEAAPFSPAWKGLRTSVERALRLIEDGALDEGSVEDLAERLGVGARHLRRLLQKHLGANPVAEIAMRSGFGSLRRFNAVFSEVYRRPPTAIRRATTVQCST